MDRRVPGQKRAFVKRNVLTGWTPLLEAAMKGDPMAFLTCLEAGDAISEVGTIDGATALHGAVHSCSLEIAKLCLDFGADATVEDGSGESPLGIAVTKNDLRMVSLLLASDPTPTKDWVSTVEDASMDKSMADLVQKFLKVRSDAAVIASAQAARARLGF